MYVQRIHFQIARYYETARRKSMLSARRTHVNCAHDKQMAVSYVQIVLGRFMLRRSLRWPRHGNSSGVASRMHTYSCHHRNGWLNKGERAVKKRKETSEVNKLERHAIKSSMLVYSVCCVYWLDVCVYLYVYAFFWWKTSNAVVLHFRHPSILNLKTWKTSGFAIIKTHIVQHPTENLIAHFRRSICHTHILFCLFGDILKTFSRTRSIGHLDTHTQKLCKNLLSRPSDVFRIETKNVQAKCVIL